MDPTVQAPRAAEDAESPPDAPPVERKRMPYLPALDGVRGIGIFVVLFWHAHVSWLSDGALFVLETFFVLSGFLITSLFIVERHNTGRINLRRFWHRRFRRLLPAFVPLFLIVTLYAAWQAAPTELNRIRGDGVTSATYTSNWWFIFSGESYFEGFATPSPFRHTWSLSVEEQFYLIIAVLVAFAFKRWGSTHRSYFWIALAGGVASAVWMATLARIGVVTSDGLFPFGIDPASLPHWVQVFFNFEPGNDVSRLYYGTDTRLQGSLVGVATAFLVAKIDLTKVKQRTFEILAIIGIGGQFFGWLAIQGKGLHWMYYGGFFLWDLIVAAGIVAMMAPKGTYIGRWISWKPIVWFGGLSYSIYVLHWPIFVWIESAFATSMNFIPLTALKFAVTFAVSYLSFRFFENPIRYNGLPTPGKKIAMAVTVVVLAVCFLTASTVGARSGNELVAPSDLPEGLLPVMVAGDSSAQVLYQYLGGQADVPAGFAIYPSVLLGCGLAAGDIYIGDQALSTSAECQTWRDLWRSNTEAIDPVATFILAWGWDLYDRRYADADGNLVDVPLGSDLWLQLQEDLVQEAIDITTAEGGIAILVNLPCIDAEANLPLRPDNMELLSEPHRVPTMNALLDRMAQRNSERAVVFDLASLLCPDGENYLVYVGDTLISSDGFHLTPEGALMVWQRMVEFLYQVLGIDPQARADAAAAQQRGTSSGGTTVQPKSEAYLGASIGLSQEESACVSRGLQIKGLSPDVFYQPGSASHLAVIEVQSRCVQDAGAYD